MIEQSLFSVPLWLSTVPEIDGYRKDMVLEVDKLIDKQLEGGKEDRYLAHQTRTDPFKLPSAGWKILDNSIKIAFSSIIRERLPRYVNGELHIRRWAIRYGTLSVDESQILKEESVHSHCPAILTAVFYLNVPNEIEGGAISKTRFFNCLPPITRLLTQKTRDLGGESGSLIIFPGDIEHTSLCEHWASNGDEKRIVVVSDVYFVGGFQDRPSDENVLRMAF